MGCSENGSDNLCSAHRVWVNLKMERERIIERKRVRQIIQDANGARDKIETQLTLVSHGAPGILLVDSYNKIVFKSGKWYDTTDSSNPHKYSVTKSGWVDKHNELILML